MVVDQVDATTCPTRLVNWQLVVLLVTLCDRRTTNWKRRWRRLLLRCCVRSPWCVLGVHRPASGVTV